MASRIKARTTLVRLMPHKNTKIPINLNKSARHISLSIYRSFPLLGSGSGSLMDAVEPTNTSPPAGGDECLEQGGSAPLEAADNPKATISATTDTATTTATDTDAPSPSSASTDTKDATDATVASNGIVADGGDEDSLAAENSRLRALVAQQQEHIQLLRTLLERTQHSLSSHLGPLGLATAHQFEQLKADVSLLELDAHQRKQALLGSSSAAASSSPSLPSIPSTLSLPFQSANAANAATNTDDAAASLVSASDAPFADLMDGAARVSSSASIDDDDELDDDAGDDGADEKDDSVVVTRTPLSADADATATPPAPVLTKSAVFNGEYVILRCTLTRAHSFRISLTLGLRQMEGRECRRLHQLQLVVAESAVPAATPRTSQSLNHSGAR